MSYLRLMRHGVDAAAMATGALRYMQRRASDVATIAMYHRVLPDRECADYPLSNLVVPESCFERQVDWLSRRARVKTVGEVVKSGADFAGDGPTVCLTFDDGYFDNAEVVAPILESKGLRATFFVTTGFVEGGSMMWFDRAAIHWRRRPDECRTTLGRRAAGESTYEDPRSLDDWLTLMKRIPPAVRTKVLDDLDSVDGLVDAAPRFRPMSVPQVRGLADRGHEIGNHTVTHPFLPGASPAELDVEIAGAKRTLQEWTGQDVAGFCYPAGDLSDAVVDVVRRTGHAYACTTQSGSNVGGADPLRLRRRFIHPSGSTDPFGNASILAFRAEMFGLHDLQRGRS